MLTCCLGKFGEGFTQAYFGLLPALLLLPREQTSAFAHIDLPDQMWQLTFNLQ